MLPARRKNVPARQPLEAEDVVEGVTVAAQACAQHFTRLGGMDHAVATEAEHKEDRPASCRRREDRRP
jgi:hypothetical protein